MCFGNCLLLEAQTPPRPRPCASRVGPAPPRLHPRLSRASGGGGRSRGGRGRGGEQPGSAHGADVAGPERRPTPRVAADLHQRLDAGQLEGARASLSLQILYGIAQQRRSPMGVSRHKTSPRSTDARIHASRAPHVHLHHTTPVACRVFVRIQFSLLITASHHKALHRTPHRHVTSYQLHSHERRSSTEVSTALPMASLVFGVVLVGPRAANSSRAHPQHSSDSDTPAPSAGLPSVRRLPEVMGRRMCGGDQSTM